DEHELVFAWRGGVAHHGAERAGGGGDALGVRTRRDPHGRAYADRRRLGLRPRFGAAVCVAIEALAALAAVQARGQALRTEHRWPEARLLVELAVDRLHHRLRDVEPGEVEQLEGTEPEALAVEGNLLAQDAVDRLDLGDAFAQRHERLGAVGAPGVVHDE